MPYTWLFIDADDTLFDYSRAESNALARSFVDFNLPYSDETLLAYQKFNHLSWYEFEQGLINAEKLRVIRFERLFSHLGIQSDPESFSRRYLVNLAGGFFLIEGVKELIPKLAGRYRLGLITNGLPEVQRPRLAGSGLAPFFQFVTISEEIGLAKPDPRFFAVALAQAGDPDPRSVLVIGDSLSSDIRGGFQSSLDTLWYNPPSAPQVPGTSAGFPTSKPADVRWPATYEAADLYTIEHLLL